MKKYIDTIFSKEQNKILKVALKYENGYNRKVFTQLPMDIVEYESGVSSILFRCYFINISTDKLYVNTPTQREDGSHINADTQRSILGGYNNATAAHVKSLFMDVVKDKNIMISAIGPEDGGDTVYVDNSLLEIFTQGQPASEYELRTTSPRGLVYVMHDDRCIGGLLPIAYNKK